MDCTGCEEGKESGRNERSVHSVYFLYNRNADEGGRESGGEAGRVVETKELKVDECCCNHRSGYQFPTSTGPDVIILHKIDSGHNSKVCSSLRILPVLFAC